MRHADQPREDEALLLIIQQELAKRCKKSKTRGHPGTTAEIVLRMMLPLLPKRWQCCLQISITKHPNPYGGPAPTFHLLDINRTAPSTDPLI